MTPSSKKDDVVPEDLITIGHVAGAHGIQGWIRVRPYSPDAETLMTVSSWWLDQPELHPVSVMRTRDHGEEVLALLSSVRSRDEAEALKGAAVQVSRRLFPQLDEGEYYWVDLIGLAVFNLKGEHLGVVHDLMDNGVHQILRVHVPLASEDEKQRELLIPFLDPFLGEISFEKGSIIVDWESDY